MSKLILLRFEIKVFVQTVQYGKYNIIVFFFFFFFYVNLYDDRLV